MSMENLHWAPCGTIVSIPFWPTEMYLVEMMKDQMGHLYLQLHNSPGTFQNFQEYTIWECDPKLRIAKGTHL